MPAVVHYEAKVLAKKAAVAMTDEAMSQRGATQTYFTAAATKNAWDPDTLVVIEDNAAVVSPSNYEVNHLMGTVTFADSYTVTGPVTVTGAYVPRTEITSARSTSSSPSRAVVDISLLGDDATKIKMGRQDCTGTIDCLEVGEDDHDGVQLKDQLSGAYQLYEFLPDRSDTKVLRAWVKFNQLNLDAAGDNPQMAILSFSGHLPENATKLWSFGDPTQ